MDDDNCMRKCVTLEDEEARQRDSPGKQLWTKIWMICT